MTPIAPSDPCNTPPPSILEKTEENSGFTLIELSIVLVIIGLLIGSIVVGKEMIVQAAIRSQISQIEKFQTAVNAFREKYNCLPGDCYKAAQYGFSSRTNLTGDGDGNGSIQGVQNAAALYYESRLFWRDLSDAKLIAEAFTGANDFTTFTITSAQLATYFPRAKLKSGAFVVAFRGGTSTTPDGVNYWGLSTTDSILFGGYSALPALSTAEAYSMDAKADDGMPQSGTITARHLGGGWVSGDIVNIPGFGNGVNPGGAYDSVTLGAVTSATSPAVSTPASATTCYDNGNVANATERYSVATNNGNGINCALAFRMQ